MWLEWQGNSKGCQVTVSLEKLEGWYELDCQGRLSQRTADGAPGALWPLLPAEGASGAGH